MTKLLATCLACSLLAACGAGSPEQVLIGAWGLDPVVLQEELRNAAARGAMARSMAAAKAETTLQIRLEFFPGGKVTLTGRGMDGDGTYAIDKVQDGVVMLTAAGTGGLPGRLTFTIIDDNRMVMSDPSKAFEWRLIRH
jgi:hypothetical protein